MHAGSCAADLRCARAPSLRAQWRSTSPRLATSASRVAAIDTGPSAGRSANGTASSTSHAAAGGDVEVPAQRAGRVAETHRRSRRAAAGAARQVAHHAALLERRGAESARRRSRHDAGGAVHERRHRHATRSSGSRRCRRCPGTTATAATPGRGATPRRGARPRGARPSFATRYTARACGAARLDRRKRGDGEREIATAPRRRRDRQHALRERDRDLRVRPGDQLAVRVQEGLQREAARGRARACPPRSGSPRWSRRRHPPVSSTTARGAASAGGGRAARTRPRRGRSRRANARSRTDARRAGGSRAVAAAGACVQDSRRCREHPPPGR